LAWMRESNLTELKNGLKALGVSKPYYSK